MLKNLDNLPILTVNNRDEYPAWHEYYEKVYDNPVSYNVDLNSFTWFYWFSPIKLKTDEIFIITSWKSVSQKTVKIPNNVPFLFRYDIRSAEYNIGNSGFFVKREKTIYNHDRLEVFRTIESVFVEKGVCWFFVTIGSGYYLKSDKKCFVGDRNDISGFKEIEPYDSMYNHNIQTLILETGVFDITGLIEVVFLLKDKYEIANTANIPMYTGNRSNYKAYSHKYSPVTKCLTK